MTATLRLGSRRSPMAVAQSRQVAGMITGRTGRQVEIVGVTTLGDVSRAELTQIGGTGVFVSALREALLSGEVDLAVHSLKDLPASPVGLDFELTQHGEVTFVVPVCHGPFLRHVCAAVGPTDVLGSAEGPVSRPMARARCPASPRLCAPSFRYGRDRSEHPLRERIGNEQVPSALNRLGPAGPTVSEY